MPLKYVGLDPGSINTVRCRYVPVLVMFGCCCAAPQYDPWMAFHDPWMAFRAVIANTGIALGLVHFPATPHADVNSCLAPAQLCSADPGGIRLAPDRGTGHEKRQLTIDRPLPSRAVEKDEHKPSRSMDTSLNESLELILHYPLFLFLPY
jgi:hypothetical protein